ncbi:MAG: hypothetical protein ACE5FY_02010 [Nitrospiria bacterium]
MYFSSRKTKQIITVLIGIPLAFLLTHCAESFDKPPEAVKVKVAEEITSDLSSPFDIAIVPDEAAAAKPGQTLHHNDLLVANFGDHTIRQIDKSTEPPTVRLFADADDTTALNQPTGIAVETKSLRGDIYVSNFLNQDGSIGGAITVFDKSGNLKGVIDDPLFNGARGIAYDVHHSSATEAIFFVSNMNNSTILKVVTNPALPPADPSTTITLYADLTFLGLGGKNPTQLAISPIEPHNLYAANTGLRPPEEPLGSTISIIPTAPATAIPVPTSDIRVILAGEVSGPLPLGFDNEGRLFTSDHAKGTLVMIDPQIGLKIASVETGEAKMYGMAVGEGGVYLTAVAGGRIIEVAKSLLTGAAEGGGGHHQ